MTYRELATRLDGLLAVPITPFTPENQSHCNCIGDV